jgi:hypothetical protein
MADQNEQIERRTYVGETGTYALGSMADFRVGQSYQLHFTRLGDGNVSIELNHAPKLGQYLVVQEVDFEKWFKK